MATQRALTWLEHELYFALRQEAKILRAQNAPNAEWTDRICRVFKQIAQKNGYVQWHKGNPRELLWDITWTSGSTSTNERKEKWNPVLSCEIEWNDGGVALQNFRKLPLSAAPYKILIFNREWIGSKGSKKERGIEKLNEMLDVIPQKGKNYLFFIVKSNNDKRPNMKVPIISYHAYIS